MNDYISREAALNAQNKSMNLREMRIRLERLPAADVAPVVHGYWIMTEFVSEDTGIWWSWHCSNCGDTYDGLGKLDERKHKYCPHCGAIMDGGEKDAVDQRGKIGGRVF